MEPSASTHAHRLGGNQPEDPSHRIIVVGGGILGASVAWALCKRGDRQVVLLEAQTFGSGVTGASGGMLRVLHPEPELSDLAREGFFAFAGFREESGDSCGFTCTGMLYIEDESALPWLAGECARLATERYPMEILRAEEARERFPAMAWSDRDVAVFEPEAGFADPQATTLALVREAQRYGALAIEHQRVERILAEGGRVCGVRTAAGDIAASTVVLASGTWSQPLLEPLGLDLGLYLKAIQTVKVTHCSDAAAAVPYVRGNHPCFFDVPRETFGRPDGLESSRVGVVVYDRHQAPGPLALDAAAARQAADRAARRLGALTLGREPGGVRTVDAYGPAGSGLLGPARDLPGLFYCLGWGGTGFKVALALGERLASEAYRT